jgi:TIR domain/Pentapeptide repeats (8 copies)
VANEEQVCLLKRGPAAWNNRRRALLCTESPVSSADLRLDYRTFEPDLSEADLSGADLSGADLSEADLRGANLSGANLSRTNLRWADLTRADLSGASLKGASLSEANLSRTDLIKADLSNADLVRASLWRTNFSEAIVTEADFTGATFSETLFVAMDITNCKGLWSSLHYGPSVVDIRTLQLSSLRHIPLNFLRGVGLPDALIDYLPSLTSQPIQHYSCFISYSTKDQRFADRLHADLQNKGVRCWFAPHDLPIGAKTWDAIDEAIRLRDKLLVVLSQASIASDWVEDEVSKAYAEERERKSTMLFPIRIDSSVMDTNEPWARKLRDQRNIGDFCSWHDPDAYQRAFDRLLRDLQVKTG